MYPISLSFDRVLKRIRTLMKNGHHAEALVTSVFTFEKLMRRSLRRAIIARGFTLGHADILLDRAGFDDVKAMWEVFEKDHKRLPAILGAAWQDIPKAKTMRNNLVHGNTVYSLSDCKDMAKEVLKALKALHKFVVDDYGVDPWSKKPKMKATLPWDP